MFDVGTLSFKRTRTRCEPGRSHLITSPTPSGATVADDLQTADGFVTPVHRCRAADVCHALTQPCGASGGPVRGCSAPGRYKLHVRAAVPTAASLSEWRAGTASPVARALLVSCL